MKRSFIALAIFMALALNFHPEQEIFSQEKVNYIHNSQKGQWENVLSKRIILVPGLTLGVEEGDENQVFFHPSSVKVDKEGNIFVLDRGNYRLQKFNKDGKFLKSIGRKGKGPGEFLYPIDMDIDSQGNIYIIDYENKKLQKFANDGIFLNSFKLPFAPIAISLDSEGSFYISYDTFYGVGKHLIYKYNHKGELIKSFVRTIKHRDRMIQAALNNVSFCIDKQDNFYICYMFDKYRIQKYNKDGELILEFSRDLPYPTFYPEATRKKNPDGTMNEGVYTPQTTLSITCDDSSYIYILLGGENKDYMRDDGNLVIDIFNSEGNFLSKFKTGKSHIDKIYKSSQGNIYLLDGWHDMRVFEYSLRMDR